MIAKTFYALKERVSSEVPTLTDVQMYHGQYTKPQENEISVPAVYISFDSVEFSNMRANAQIAKMNITLHVVNAVFNELGNILQTAATDDILNLLEEVHKAVQGWRVPNIACSVFNRSSMAYIDGYSPLDIWTISYDFSIQ